MCTAFCEGAQAAGHQAEILHAGRMKINGCLGCEYCHTKGEGRCIQKDDMEKIMPAYLESDMIVLASPIYYFSMSAQLSAAIQRVYCIGKPAAGKAVLLLSTATGQTDAAEACFKQITAFMGMENCGVCKVVGEDNKKAEKMAENVIVI
jgi:multimeric flavodoxin WrbA